MAKRVALVIVSHSQKIASGVKELASDMAPDVYIAAAGGDPEGGLGTSYDLVERAAHKAAQKAGKKGVVLLTDLGSATMTAEMFLELSEDDSIYRLAVGPLVEGAVVAAIAAQNKMSKNHVVREVADAARSLSEQAERAAQAAGETLGYGDQIAEHGHGEDRGFTMSAKVVDETGLHARPAAKLARLASSYQAKVLVNGVSAASVMEIMSLGVKKGDEVRITAVGADAATAAREVADAIEAGFDS